MKGRTVQVADAVVELVNGHTFSIAFTATRQYLPKVKLDALSSITVVVVPRGVKNELLTRGSQTLVEHSIEIGVQFHCSDINDPDTTDPVSYLVDEIQSLLLGSSVDGADCVEVQSILADDSIFAKEHMTNDNVLTSVCVARFLE